MTGSTEARTVLVTGAAGFIGFHLAERHLAAGDHVIGLDNVNDYYDVALKEARLARLATHPRFTFARLDLGDRASLEALFRQHRFDLVVHLAAQAGVRYSLVNPQAYVDSNITGFLNILEMCRNAGIEHLVYASSSSVYGALTAMPFSVRQNVDHPVSLYAASKKANELMAHTYSHLFALPTTGVRFFTVYGPWGRPDMALFLFTRAILAGRPIDVFNNGEMERDFTYIDDIVEGLLRLGRRPAAPDPRLGQPIAFAEHQPRPLPPLQYRQQPTGAPAPDDRGAGGLPRTQGREAIPAAAARRRTGHLRRYRRPQARCRLRTRDADRGRHRALRAMVSGSLRGVMRAAGSRRRRSHFSVAFDASAW